MYRLEVKGYREDKWPRVMHANNDIQVVAADLDLWHISISCK